MEILAYVILGIGAVVVVGVVYLGYRLFKVKRKISSQIKKYKEKQI